MASVFANITFIVTSLPEASAPPSARPSVRHYGVAPRGFPFSERLYSQVHERGTPCLGGNLNKASF